MSLFCGFARKTGQRDQEPEFWFCGCETPDVIERMDLCRRCQLPLLDRLLARSKALQVVKSSAM